MNKDRNSERKKKVVHGERKGEERGNKLGK